MKLLTVFELSRRRVQRGIGIASLLATANAFSATNPTSAQSGAAAPAAVAKPGQPAVEGDTIMLNPFDVTAGSTKGYMATNTISGTAMNTPLKDVPMAINVITSEFL